MQMTVAFSVKGKEDLNFTLNYENTDLKTVLMVEKALMGALSGLLAQQKV